MIKVFFNETGYYTVGEGVEISRRCSPALTERGDQIFQPIHHAYRVCFLALKELAYIDVRDDVMVYSDSRIIDEVNGIAKPLDDTCEQWLQTLLRSVVPSIKAVVFFRKKSIGEIQASIDRGHKKMLPQIDERTAERITKSVDKTQERKQRAIERLRTKWFGANHDNGTKHRNS